MVLEYRDTQSFVRTGSLFITQLGRRTVSVISDWARRESKKTDFTDSVPINKPTPPNNIPSPGNISMAHDQPVSRYLPTICRAWCLIYAANHLLWVAPWPPERSTTRMRKRQNHANDIWHAEEYADDKGKCEKRL